MGVEGRHANVKVNCTLAGDWISLYFIPNYITVSSDRRSQVYLFNVGSGDSNSRHHNTGQTRYFTSCLNSPAIMNMNKSAIVELGEIFCVVDHFFSLCMFAGARPQEGWGQEIVHRHIACLRQGSDTAGPRLYSFSVCPSLRCPSFPSVNGSTFLSPIVNKLPQHTETRSSLPRCPPEVLSLRSVSKK